MSLCVGIDTKQCNHVIRDIPKPASFWILWTGWHVCLCRVGPLGSVASVGINNILRMGCVESVVSGCGLEQFSTFQCLPALPNKPGTVDKSNYLHSHTPGCLIKMQRAELEAEHIDPTHIYSSFIWTQVLVPIRLGTVRVLWPFILVDHAVLSTSAINFLLNPVLVCDLINHLCLDPENRER